MLDWLSTTAGHIDADLDIIADDAPTTPAPLFAARAFKHLIFGTPAAPEQASQRAAAQQRRTTSEPDNKATRTPPRRAISDVGAKRASSLLEPSPGRQRGILVTPGTAGARGKKVSFEQRRDGNGVMDVAAPTPRDIPGRFPASPWTVKKEIAIASEQILVQKKSAANPTMETRPRATSIDDTTLDMSRPRSTSGTYWKSEYDNYSSKSTSEMRKLAKKEQLAKKYARHKGSEAATLAEALRQEQQRVAELERQVEEYVGQLGVALREVKEERGRKGAGDRESGDLRAEERHDKTNETLQRELERERRKIEKLEKLREESERLQKENEMLKAELRKKSSTLSKKRETERSPTKKRDRLAPASPPLQPPHLDASDIWATSRPTRPSRLRSRNENDPVSTTTSINTSTDTKHKSPSPRQPLSTRNMNPLTIASSLFPADNAKRVDLAESTSHRDVEVLDVKGTGVSGTLVLKAEKTMTKTKTETLSDERKEAARRRLEEKRRARLGGKGVVV